MYCFVTLMYNNRENSAVSLDPELAHRFRRKTAKKQHQEVCLLGQNESLGITQNREPFRHRFTHCRPKHQFYSDTFTYIFVDH